MKNYWKSVLLEGLPLTFLVGVLMLLIPIFWLALPVLPALPFAYPFIKKNKTRA